MTFFFTVLFFLDYHSLITFVIFILSSRVLLSSACSTFFDFDSFIFCTIAYHDRKYWIRADLGDFGNSRKYLGQIWSCLKIIFCLQIHFSSPNSFSQLKLIRFFYNCTFYSTVMIFSRFRWFQLFEKCLGLI